MSNRDNIDADKWDHSGFEQLEKEDQHQETIYKPKHHKIDSTVHHMVSKPVHNHKKKHEERVFNNHPEYEDCRNDTKHHEGGFQNNKQNHRHKRKKKNNLNAR